MTKRIIVHGVPNVSADPLYDDPRTEVRRLLDKYHFDRYKAYTFASELAQMTPPTTGVDARVERYSLYPQISLSVALSDCPPHHSHSRLISLVFVALSSSQTHVLTEAVLTPPPLFTF